MVTASGARLIHDTPATKVSVPVLVGELVDRPRLYDALSTGLDSPDATFMMVNAPAGYGKTSLLAQWSAAAKKEGVVVAWCDLDTDDRDPLVFWGSLLAALGVAAAGNDAAERALGSLEVSMAPRRHSELLAGLTRALDLLGPRTALVFDDTHLLADGPSEAEFIRLLGLVPASVYVVFATRSSLLEQRARLTNRLRELTADSLSFTRAEACALFDDDIDDDGVEALYAASDGWPAALSLAHAGVARSTGTLDTRLGLLDPDVVHQYLQREVFDDLSPLDQSTILTAGICPLVTASLANAVCTSLDSAHALRRLASNNPMLRRVSTDDRGRIWYRVQPLFRSFLREKIVELSPTALRQMTTSAAQWHMTNGDPLVALRLALDVLDAELVDTVLRRCAYALVAEGHGVEMLALAGSTTGRATAGPFASLMLAWASADCGEADRASEAVARVRPTGLDVDDLFEWDWLLYLVQLRIALLRGECIDGLSSGWADSTMLALPDDLREALHLGRGLAETRVGQNVRATEELEASRAIAENIGDLSVQTMSAVGLAATRLAATDLRACLRHALSALEIADRSPGRASNTALAHAHTLAGWAKYQLLDESAARDHLRAASDFAGRQHIDEVAMGTRHALHAVTFDSLPDKRRAAQDFTTAWPPPYLLGAPPSAVVSSLHFGIRMSLTIGEHRWSERLLDRARHLIGEGHDWNVAYALLLYSTGRQSSARSILTPLLHESRGPRTPVSEIVEWSLESVFEHESGNAFRAHAAMCRSLERADDTGALAEVVRPGGDSVRAVLAHGLHRFGKHDAVAAQLLARGRETLEPTQAAGALTPKERELLSELKTLRTVGEISDDMLLSINTVKTHMRGIYRKLGVTSRRSAIAEAERLGLV
ncbi:LuxR C-terminal-related transcriptional regulator [Conyzicola sp.]|uniref:LuxR C-terminal-related transcriptional regulator n=1 Tax=Conyzicola sp. TaxID=1969404 RepID=UPI0039899FE5